jgi:hypothetical protein
MTNQTMPGPAWIPNFLATLAETKCVGDAIRAAGVARNSIYFQRKRNPQFVEAWKGALLVSVTKPCPVPTADEPSTRKGGWKTPFLEALAETSSVRESARRADVPLRTVYKTRRGDPDFAAKWRDALYEGYDNLEMEVLGYLRDAQPSRKMDVASALRLLVAHRETVARERALREDDDEQAVLESIDQFIEDMRQRRLANEAILLETPADDDGAE